MEKEKTAVKSFVVAGGSKRGWTTWTTAAVDHRVVAIIPMVIDVLNTEACMKHHYAAYGFWAPAVGDYVRNGVTKWTGTPEHRALMAIEDPYSYRDRYTMPKLIINAAGDQYFLPDSSQFYYDDLPVEKHLRYVANTDHSLRDSDARESIFAFYESVLTGSKRPEFSWAFQDDGSIRVQTPTKPRKVELWQANNPSARDFRVESLGRMYKATALAEQGQGAYLASPTKPEKGWTAYFVELTFDSGGRFPFKFTTPVRVKPDTLPFKDKKPEP
jgi:PhoPQ-activated pathogenicity-related protein